ncbi:MAG TPA: citrate lyase subunit alpha, partial [Tissierellaceae bacterium]|nr:citrate lyase subunit alpha [Tissierellaceae bacterium]
MNYLNNNLDTVKVLEQSKFPSKVQTKDKVSRDLTDTIKRLNLHDGAVVSFHHHLRNGDRVLNIV